MRVAVALSYSELPLSLIEAHGPAERVHERGGEKEVRFGSRAQPALPPVWWDGQLHVLLGEQRSTRAQVAIDRVAWHDTLESGRWRELFPRPGLIPAGCGYMGEMWFEVKEGYKE